MRHVSRLPGTSTEFSWDIENSLHLHTSGKVAQVFKDFFAAFSHFPRACGRANKHAALHTCTDAVQTNMTLCTYTRPFANKHGALHKCTGLMHMCRAACSCARAGFHKHLVFSTKYKPESDATS